MHLILTAALAVFVIAWAVALAAVAFAVPEG